RGRRRRGGRRCGRPRLRSWRNSSGEACSVPSTYPHPARVAAMRPFKSITYSSASPGPRLIVLGAVHGDETCGTRAIERLVGELDRGEIAVAAGPLDVVPGP